MIKLIKLLRLPNIKNIKLTVSECLNSQVDLKLCSCKKLDIHLYTKERQKYKFICPKSNI